MKEVEWIGSNPIGELKTMIQGPFFQHAITYPFVLFPGLHFSCRLFYSTCANSGGFQRVVGPSQVA